MYPILAFQPKQRPSKAKRPALNRPSSHRMTVNDDGEANLSSSFMSKLGEAVGRLGDQLLCIAPTCHELVKSTNL